MPRIIFKKEKGICKLVLFPEKKARKIIKAENEKICYALLCVHLYRKKLQPLAIRILKLEAKIILGMEKT